MDILGWRKSIKHCNRSILESDAQYIVHQLNCVTNTSAGLARAIFSRFPYADVYSHRKYPHSPTVEEQMGNIIIRGDGRDDRYVIGIYGQYYPGKPKFHNSVRDGYKARENAFANGLLRIAEIEGISSVSFPSKIGCTLAGGDWDKYERMIIEWSEQHDIDVSIYNYVNQ